MMSEWKQFKKVKYYLSKFMNIKYYQINGEIKRSDKALISVDDYGLMRGYGIFETIRFNNKKLLKINRHIDRLYKGLSVIKIKIEHISREKLIADINNLVEINNIENNKDSLEIYAREKLGLIKENETFYQIIKNDSESN